MRRQVSPERVAAIVADAVLMGSAAAAKKWGVGRRTVDRYREKAESDSKMAESVSKAAKANTKALAAIREDFLRDALEAMRIKLAGASLPEVAAAYKAVGEQHLAGKAMGEGRDERPVRVGEEVPEDGGGRGRLASGDSGPRLAAH